MERHVEFVMQLSHLVALHTREPVDVLAERAALRAARVAAKYGVIDIYMVEGQLRAGFLEAAALSPEIAALQTLLRVLGVTHIRAEHQAKQEEIRQLAVVLGGVAAGRLDATGFLDAVAEYPWSEIGIECSALGVGEGDDKTTETVATAPQLAAAEEPSPDAASAADAAAATPAADTPAETAPAATAFVHETPTAVPTELAHPGTPDAAMREEGPSAEASLAESAAAEAVVEPSAEPVPPPRTSGPLAIVVPAAVEQLVDSKHQELFRRLITSSEPGTLRRLLEPVQLVIEQSVREGTVATAVRLLLAMFACEACADDEEMRRQFLVTMRRLTKPTLLRAFAMLYLDEPALANEAEQVLARFDEDGAEAVIDRVGGAPTAEVRAAYVALLRRLPGTHDALLAMLDDEREIVIQRAMELMVELRHTALERVLGEQLGHRSARVRQAAARGLALVTESSFAADALVRAADDATPDVRLAAAVALQSRRDARLAAPIAARLDEEPEIEVQLALVAALGRLAASEGVQKLIALSTPNERMMRRRNISVLRLGAIEALGEARTPAAMIALQKLLEDRDKDVREAAARLYTRARRQTTAAGMAAIIEAGPDA